MTPVDEIPVIKLPKCWGLKDDLIRDAARMLHTRADVPPRVRPLSVDPLRGGSYGGPVAPLWPGVLYIGVAIGSPRNTSWEDYLAEPIPGTLGLTVFKQSDHVDSDGDIEGNTWWLYRDEVNGTSRAYLAAETIRRLYLPPPPDPLGNRRQFRSLEVPKLVVPTPKRLITC